MNKKIVLACLVAIFAVMLAGCGYQQPTDNTAADQSPIKIGWIGPLTGESAIYGEPISKIAQMAVDEINSQGGIDGRNIQLLLEDGKCTGQDAVTAAQKLINVDKVQAIIGGFCSGESIPIIPLAEENKVFLFSPTASSPDLTNISKFFARDYPSDASQGITLANVAYNDMKWKKMAVIQEQTEYAKGLYTSFSKQFTDLGGQVTKEEFASGRVDFRTTLNKMKSQKPDAVLIDSQSAATAERILKQMQEMNWRPHLLINDTVIVELATVEKNKDMLEGALGAEYGVDLNNPKFQQMVRSFKDKYGKEMPYQGYGQTEYDSVYILRDAIKAVGYSGEKIAAWVQNLRDWQGASGSVTIENGDRVGGHIAKIIKNGKVEIFKP